MLLSVHDLCVQTSGARPVQLVHEVSLDVAPGEICGLVGESGSGKTLTGLAIMGLLPANLRASGSVRLDGQELLSADRTELRRLRGATLSMISQEPRAALNPVLKIRAQLAQVLRAHETRLDRQTVRKRIGGALDSAGIPDPDRCANSYPHELSGGMCQRVMIAMALLCGPRLIIADEPTTALDVTVQAQVLRLLVDLARANDVAVVLITHDLAVVAGVCERLVTMYAGEIVERARVATVLHRPRHPYTARLLHAARGEPATVPAPAPESAGPMECSAERAVAADAAHPPAGCRFHPRCAYAEPACVNAHPDLVGLDGRDSVRCVRHPDLELRGV